MQVQLSIVSAPSKLYQDDINQLLEQQRLRYELDIEYLCIVRNHQGEVIGCVGLSGRILKCFALKEEYQGAGISRSMITEIILLAFQLQRKSLSIFTNPDKVAIFQSMGFTPLTTLCRHSVLLVNKPEEIIALQAQLTKTKVNGDRIAVIVINANPFTKGHASLIEQAAKECDWIHVFVVREENPPFTFLDRWTMVLEGTKQIGNLTLHQGNDYIISKRTFPSYFLKNIGEVNHLHAEIDCEIFCKYIAPCLGITHRYVGSEPHCAITRNYNQVMRQILSPEIKVVEVERIVINGTCISASTVRKQLINTTSLVTSLLPISTINYLIEHCGYTLQI